MLLSTLDQRADRVLWELSVHHPLQLAVFRVAYAAYVLLSNQPPALSWIPGLPSHFRSAPPGLPSLLPAPSPLLALLLEALLVVAVVALLVGWRTRSASFAVGVLALINSAMAFSFGKIDHTIMLWVVPLVFASSSWGDRLSIDARRNPSVKRTVSPTPQVPVLATILSFGFATAALPKLAGGWLAFDESATRSYFDSRVARGAVTPLTGTLTELDSALFWELLDWMTVIFEVGAAAVFLFPAAYRLMAVVAGGFHIATHLVMDISFEFSLIVYLAVAIQSLDVDRTSELLDRARSLLDRWKPAIWAAIAVAAAAQLWGPGLLRLVASDVLQIPEWWVGLAVQLSLSAVLAGLVLPAERRAFTARRSEWIRRGPA
jgi:uncharacterized membrane protein YphA (DoxX/SURF4 family)